AFLRIARDDCGEPMPCDGWCARHISRRHSSYCRCSCDRGEESGSRLVRCRACVRRPSTRCCVMLFGIPDVKDAIGSSAWDDQGPVQEEVRTLKRETPRLVVITGVHVRI